jgi:hypothetical protein
MSTPFTLTPEQRDEFDRRGLLHLPGLLSADTVRAAHERIVRQLARGGITQAGGWRLADGSKPQWPDRGVKTPKAIGNRHAEIEALLEEPALLAAVDALLDGRPFDRSIFKRPSLLFTLPNAETWIMPDGWHTDSARLASRRRPGVQLFGLLDRLEPGGGATLVVAGSHRLLNDGQFYKNRQINGLLRREPFFRALFSARPAAATDNPAGLPRGAVGDVPLEVVELTGSPGDAWITDLRVLHSGAPNASARPRMMATYRFWPSDVVAETAEAYGWRPEEGSE